MDDGILFLTGVYNTPDALSSQWAGCEWDERTGRWIMYNLVEEAELVLKMDEKV